MKFWFDLESAYNVPNLSRSYVIDIDNERIQRMMEYEHYRDMMRGHATKRTSDHDFIAGAVISEFTFTNEAWSYLVGCLLGKRTSISGYKFKENLAKPWGFVVGYLDSNLTADGTTVEINGDSTSLFDSAEALIINDEFIDVGSITANVAANCTRAQQGTTARAHSEKDLVYGIVADGAREIVLCHRNMVGGFREFGYSLTTVLDRDSILFAYSGMFINDATFNFRVFDSIKTHMEFSGADSTNDVILGASAITDNNPIIDLQDIKVFSNHAEEKLRQFYIQVHNSIRAGSYGFDGKVQELFLTGSATYGTLTWTDDALNHVTEYEDNTRRHFSVSAALGNYRMIFAINNIRVNTISHYHDGDLIIQDSAPFYVYEEPVIMFQF